MYVLARVERGAQPVVPGQVRHDAQLDLRVVGREQHVSRRSDEGLPDAAPFGRTDRNILQVRVGRRQSSGRRDGLVIRGMHAARRLGNLQRQLVRIGAPELADAAVVDYHPRQVVVAREFDEHVLGRRRLAFRRFANDRQLQLVEQDFLQLLRGAEVERSASEIVRLLFERLHFLREFLALLGEHVPVEQHARFLHPEQHRDQRLLDVGIDLPERFYLAEFLPQRLVQLQRDVGVLGRVRRGRVDVDLVERQLLRALAGDVFVMNRLAAEVKPGHRIHVVAGRDAVQHVGLEHRIERHALQPDAVSGKHVGVVLEVVADLFLLRIFEPRPELFEHLVTRQLLGCARVIVRDRDVRGLAGFHRQRHADDFGLHVVEARRLGVDRDEPGLADFLEPLVERLPVQHGFIVAGLSGFRFRRCIRVAELAEQRAQFEMPVQLPEFVRVAVSCNEIIDRHVEIAVEPDRRELLRQHQRVDIVAQAFADLALDLAGMLDDAVGAFVVVEPLRRGFRPDLGHARDVVRAVADEREVVDDLLGPDVELFLDRVAIEHAVVHRVDERHVIVDELREILVARRHEYALFFLRSLTAQRADHVIGLDALDLQQRQTHRPNGLEYRLDLAPEVVGHRRPRRLVLAVNVVAKRLARRVEHDRDMRVGLFAYELVDHRQHAVQRAGRLARRIRKVRQRVVRPVKVGRAVDQYEVSTGHVAAASLRVAFAVFFVVFLGLLGCLDLARVAGDVQRAALAAAGEHESEQQGQQDFQGHGRSLGTGCADYIGFRDGYFRRVKSGDNRLF